MSFILVVDGDPDLRQAVAATLERTGHEVRQAADVAEAFELVQEHVPAAVLLDYQVPALDSRGFLAALQALPTLADVPVLLTSAHEEEARALAREFPSVHLLPKPFRAADLRRAVDQVAPEPPRQIDLCSQPSQLDTKSSKSFR